MQSFLRPAILVTLLFALPARAAELEPALLAEARAAVDDFLDASSRTGERDALARIEAIPGASQAPLPSLLSFDQRVLPEQAEQPAVRFPLGALTGHAFLQLPGREEVARPGLVLVLPPAQLDDQQTLDFVTSALGQRLVEAGWVVAVPRPFLLDSVLTFQKDRTRPHYQPWIRGSAEVVPYLAAWLCRLLPIDTDRVHLLGFADGGDGALWAACRYTDRFASVTAVDGHLSGRNPTGWAANLRQLPVQLARGFLQRSDSLARTEGLGQLLSSLGVGVDLLTPGDEDPEEPFPVDRFLEWIEAHRRPVIDRTLRLFTDRPGYGDHQWARVDACGGNARLELRAEREGNRIIVGRRDQIEALTLYLDRTLLDPAAPVTVVVDDRALPPVSPERGLEQALRRWKTYGDPTRLYRSALELRF